MAKEYIEREAALSHPFANGHYDHEHAPEDFILGHESYKEWLEQLPAADVRPVVRCKDCINYEMGVCLKIYDDGTAAKEAWQERKPDDFCSYGEQREADDED